LVVEHPRDAHERLAALLERNHRVLERCGRSLARDRGDFSELLFKAPLKRGHEMLIADVGKGRQLIRQRTGLEERIRHGTSLRSRASPRRAELFSGGPESAPP